MYIYINIYIYVCMYIYIPKFLYLSEKSFIMEDPTKHRILPSLFYLKILVEYIQIIYRFDSEKRLKIVVRTIT